MAAAGGPGDGARHLELRRHLEERVAVAIDGHIYWDTLLEPIRPDVEVFILPRLAAAGRGCPGLASRPISRRSTRDPAGCPAHIGRHVSLAPFWTIGYR